MRLLSKVPQFLVPFVSRTGRRTRFSPKENSRIVAELNTFSHGFGATYRVHLYLARA